MGLWKISKNDRSFPWMGWRKAWSWFVGNRSQIVDDDGVSWVLSYARSAARFIFIACSPDLLRLFFCKKRRAWVMLDAANWASASIPYPRCTIAGTPDFSRDPRLQSIGLTEKSSILLWNSKEKPYCNKYLHCELPRISRGEWNNFSRNIRKIMNIAE